MPQEQGRLEHGRIRDDDRERDPVVANTRTRPERRVLMGVVAAFTMATSAPAATVPCPATAALEGPPGITIPIARGLRAHGVNVGASGTCATRSVRAIVSTAPSGKGFKLHIEDGFGRTSDRYVAEADTAVSLIESWVVDDESDLLAVPPPTAAPPSATLTAAPAAAGAVSLLRLYAGPRALVGSDSTVGVGAVAGGCGRIGFACLGAELGFVHDLGVSGGTTDAGTSRDAINAYVTAGVPLSRGRFFLMPAIGVGAGWTRTHVAAEEMDMTAATATTLGLRGQVSVMAGVSITSHVTLALDLAALVAPGARPPPPEVSTSTPTPLPAEPLGSLAAGLTCLVTP
jgi:hypothetical protein